MSQKPLLDLCERVMNNFVRAKGDHWGLHIALGMFFDGEGMSYRLEEVAPKTLRLSTGGSFSEWLAYATLDYTEYKEEIEAVAKRFGAEWNEEKGELFIQFKRNELSIGEAYFRLAQAMGVIGNFRYYIHFPGKA
ncbi:MAG: hypothetical protein IJX88_00170 [Clostridia bacterium]|nr:hypothetical protein [Clostridia bacterium]